MFVASRSTRLGYLKFVIPIPVGTPQVLWLCSQDPGWDTSILWLLQVCGFVIPVGIPQVLRLRGQDGGSWWLRGQDPGWGTSSLLPRGQEPGWDTSSLWLRGQDAGWDTSSLWLRSQDAGWGTSSFVADPRSGYLKFGGFVGRIPVGIPQVCGQDPGWDASSSLVSSCQDSGCDTSSLKFFGFAGHLKFCVFAIKSWGTSRFVASWSGSRLG